MLRFQISENFVADCQVSVDTRIGAIYHIKYNAAGGSVMTPVAQYFAWRPNIPEGYHPHWRVDCYIRDHTLAGDAKSMTKSLALALQKSELCAQPMWVGWHKTEEMSGEVYGELWDDD